MILLNVLILGLNFSFDLSFVLFCSISLKFQNRLVIIIIFELAATGDAILVLLLFIQMLDGLKYLGAAY